MRRLVLLVVALMLVLPVPVLGDVPQASPQEDYAHGVLAFQWRHRMNGSVDEMRVLPGAVMAYSSVGEAVLLGDAKQPLAHLDQLAAGTGCVAPSGDHLIDGRALYETGGPTYLYSVQHGYCVFFPHSEDFVLQFGRLLSRWGAGSVQAYRELSALPLRMTTSPNGSLVTLMIEGRILALDAQTLTDIFSIEPSGFSPGGGGGAVEWSPDSASLAYSLGETRVRLFTPSGTLERTLYGFTSGVNAVAWSGNGTLIAAGDRSGMVRVWNSTNWSAEAVEVYHSRDGSPVSALSFSGEGALFVGTESGYVERWTRESQTLQLYAGENRTVRVGSAEVFDVFGSRGLFGSNVFSWEVEGPQRSNGTGTTFSFVPGLEGTYILTLRAQDVYGNIGASSLSVTAFATSDARPAVVVLSPAPGSQANLPLIVVGTASDDHQVLGVTVAIDSRAPALAIGTDSWSIGLAGLAPGYHAVHVVAYDAYQASASVDFVIDAVAVVPENRGLPFVRITAPANGSDIGGKVLVVGSAGGPDAIDSVLVSNPYYAEEAIGTASWFFLLDTAEMRDGWITVVASVTDSSMDKASVSMAWYVNHAGLPHDTPPRIELKAPTNGAEVNASGFWVEGEAFSDEPLVVIQVRLDRGVWHSIAPNGTWRYFLEAGGLTTGPHVVTARAMDARGLAAANVTVTLTNYTVAESPSQTTGTGGTGSPFIPVVLGIGAGIAAGILLWRIGRPKESLHRTMVAMVTALLVAVAISTVFPGSVAPGPPGPTPPGATVPPGAQVVPDFTCMGTDSTVVTNEQSIGQAVVVYITRSNASEREFIQQFTTVATNANLSARLVALDTRPSGSVDDTASFFLSVSTLPWVVCRDVWFSIANFPYSPGSVVLLNESSAVVWHPTGYGDPSWQTALKNL